MILEEPRCSTWIIQNGKTRAYQPSHDIVFDIAPRYGTQCIDVPAPKSSSYASSAVRGYGIQRHRTLISCRQAKTYDDRRL